MVKRFALCIGQNYKGTSSALNGCLSDVDRVSKLLKRHGYSVTEVTDKNTPLRASKVISEIKSLVNRVNACREECRVFIHYSGHGCSVPDRNGDEKDHRDEVIVMGDGYYISDDMLYDMVKNFKKNTKLMCLFDCCHSGTVLDFKYHDGKEENSNNIDFDGICISGCMDNQTSADTYLGDGEYGGALTTVFIMYFTTDIPIESIVESMRKKVQMYGQIPQLTKTKNMSYTFRDLI